MGPYVSVLSFTFLVAILALCNGQNDNQLPFLHVESSGEPAGQSNYSLAVQLAVGDINRNGAILEPYTLSAVNRATMGTQCNGGVSDAVRRNLERELTSGPEEVGVISGSCRIVTETLANITLQNNIAHLSYSPNIGELSQNGSQNVFHLFPSQMDPTAILALLNVNGWRRVAVLTERNTQIEELNGTFSAGLTVTLVSLEAGGTQSPLELVDDNTRVIVLNTYPQRARTILCQAFHMEMYHPGYVWITPGWYGEGWWMVGGEESLNCTLQQLETVLNRSVTVTVEAQNSSSISGQTFDDFQRQYLAAVNGVAQFAPPSLAAYAFDAVWTLAVALNSTGLPSPTSSGMGAIEFLSREELQRISFPGITGLVEFDSSGRRVASQTIMQQYREANGSIVTVEVGSVKVGGAGFTYATGENATTLWPDGLPPRVTRINTIAIPLTVIYYILTTAAILFGVVCIVFNFVYRKRKIVQLSSPNLNYLIIAGAILLLASVYFITFPSRCSQAFEVICMANVWLAAIGGSLQYGTMQAKMFRVYIIFRKPVKKATILQNWHLAVYVLVLVIIDLVMLIAVTAVPAARSIGKLVPDQENPGSTNADGVTQVALIYDCQSRQAGLDTYWLVALFGYKLVLQLIATVLAVLLCAIRVGLKALDDSRYVLVITYVNMVMLLLAVVLAFAVNNFENAKAAVNGMIVLLAAVCNLSLVFIPTMIQLYKDPEGKRIFRARGQTLAEASRKAPSSSISKKPATSDSDNKPQKSIEESIDNEKAVHLQVDGDVTEVSDLSHRTSSMERSPAPEESRNNEVKNNSVDASVV